MLKAIFGFVGSAANAVVTNWQAIVAALAVGLLLGGTGTWRVMSWREGAHETQQATQTVRLVERQGQINVQLGDVVIRGITLAHSETSRGEQEIATHVTPQVDREYPVPLGFVRVWNDRTAGPVPGPSAGSDTDPSGVPLSTVALAHNADVGDLAICRVELSAWWDWYDQNKAAWNKATGQ